MRQVIVALATVIALLANAIAGPRKVLVLPLDGNAPAAQKSQLNDSVAKMAKAKLDGDVTVGDTTFAETAAAVGCEPRDEACAETVRSTLGVDELVYGSAETADGTTTVTVRRAAANTPAVVQTSTLAEADSGEQAESQLEPAFVSAPLAAAGSSEGSAASPERPRPASNFFDTRERKLGFGLAAGGALALIIGLSLWASASDLEDQAANYPVRTQADIADLKALEDRAGSRALWGNIMVVVGLGAGGAGAYYLYKDHKQRTATLTPAPVDAGTGMTLVLSGRW